MGLNMPAKTVVFTSVRKFDGRDFRWVTSGEYIQMSGRAGRRGLDDRGIVILMVDEKMEPHVAKNMVKGASDPLISSFHLGYNMLLNLMRVEGVDPETLIKRSFHQFQSDRALPEYELLLTDYTNQLSEIQILDEEVIKDYYNIRMQLEKFRASIRERANMPIHAVPFLQPGRLVRVTDGETEWGWGAIVNFHKKKNVDKAAAESSDYIVDILLNCSSENTKVPAPAGDGKGAFQVVPVLLSLFNGISSLRIFIPSDLRSTENRNSVALSIREVSTSLHIPFQENHILIT
jgi:ATP-dependent RNA helicase DOB1